MPLIRSISGIRGTIGGKDGEGLTPSEIVRTVSAFAFMLLEREKGREQRIVIGRDARVSGAMVRELVVGTLRACGVDVLDLGLTSTPTVELNVPVEGAMGGIILTASHNPAEWNALKLLDAEGEFISDEKGKELLQRMEERKEEYPGIDGLGSLKLEDRNAAHIEKVLALELVDEERVRQRGFRIVVDGVNSSGGVLIPALLEALGVEERILINCEADGRFAHNPEPLPEHLEELSQKVREEKADLGIAVDPDVDRLAFVDENGACFGEEYTLVAAADHVLSKRSGDTVSNLSSSRALRDVTESYGATHHASAVGEVNVVKRMKEVKAVIGGEGNGGVILPELHYGRDALVGVALFLTLLAERDCSCSELRAGYPDYFMAKEKLALDGGHDVDALLEAIAERYRDQPIDREDGVKIEFEEEWVHLRRSNTEPIVRVYTESRSPEGAADLAKRFVGELKGILKGSGTIERE